MPAYFSSKTLKFLTDLRDHNDREWFELHRSDYESRVREPALSFISACRKPMAKISAMIKVEASKVGGSLMRIHRDVRFSRDKSPYKTNIGIHFRHELGRDVHCPGFYVHIEPKGCFLGAGIWHPDASALKKIRSAIVADPDRWRAARDHRSFIKHFSLAGEALQRPPQGCPKDHSMIEDLKRKDFIGVRSIADRQIAHGDFLEQTMKAFQAASPLMAYLCEALEIPF